MATTKVYRVMTQDHMVRYYHFSTLSRAREFVREWVRDNQDWGIYPEIDTLVVELNAKGIARALDNFIDLTCANEG